MIACLELREQNPALPDRALEVAVPFRVHRVQSRSQYSDGRSVFVQRGACAMPSMRCQRH